MSDVPFSPDAPSIGVKPHVQCILMRYDQFAQNMATTAQGRKRLHKGNVSLLLLLEDKRRPACSFLYQN